MKGLWSQKLQLWLKNSWKLSCIFVVYNQHILAGYNFTTFWGVLFVSMLLSDLVSPKKKKGNFCFCCI